MDKLYDDELFIIFDYVDIIDLMKNCRLVNKRFNYLIGQLKFKELIIESSFDENDKNLNYWYFTNQKINPRNIIKFYCLDNLDLIFNSKSFKSIFGNLKNLKIHLSKCKFNIKNLNQLKTLEHLEIYGHLLVDKEFVLELPNLKLIRIQTFEKKLIINSEKLETLSFYSLKVNSIRLETFYFYALQEFCEDDQDVVVLKPETVKYLNLEYENFFYLPYNGLKILKKSSNLQILQLYIADVNLSDDFFDKILPKSLKEIHFRFDDYSNLNRILEFVIGPFLKTTFAERKLKIYLNGIRIDNKNLDNLSIDYQINQIDLFYNNYDLLANGIDWVNELDYGKLIQTFNQQLPYDLFEKFINIQVINLDKILVNQNEFLLFLNQCPNLHTLKLIEPGFNQNFYDHLPNQLLRILKLNELDDINLNFNFLLKLKLLSYFRTNHYLNDNLLNQLFNNLKFISKIQIKSH